MQESNEYLTSIFGNHTDGGIKSLAFLTNNKRVKTIGVHEGTSFSSPVEYGKIVGFYGWNSGYLRRIGAYFEPGPFGSGEAWYDKNIGVVREIHLLLHQSGIRYIRFVYDDGSENGKAIHRGDSAIIVSPDEKKVSGSCPFTFISLAKMILVYVQSRD